MKICNPFKSLSKFELALWLSSIFVVMLSFFSTSESNDLTLAASLIGVTALIFVSKGHVFGQILTVIFSMFYGIISFKFHYYGEMITYLGMTTPIAILSVITWLKNPYNGTPEVKVRRLSAKQILWLALSTAAVTIIFYFILKACGTANLIISTVSIATSFSASCLTMLRSPSYALAYAANDVVLIILWILAAVENIAYLPMIICFIMFLLNDTYGFFNWRKIQKRQSS